MATNADKDRQRFPDLSKLSIAILENLVEKIIGESAIEEVKKPYAQKEIAEALATAMSRVESEFLIRHSDHNICSALLQLPIHELPSAKSAIWVFYERPNDLQFSEILILQMSALGSLSKSQIDNAVFAYLKLLKREFVNINSELREKLQTLALLDIVDTLDEVKEFMKQRANQNADAPSFSRKHTRENAQLILDGNFNEFNETKQKELLKVLAALLHLEVKNIKVLRVSRGSIVVELEMEGIAIDRLADLVRKRDFRLRTLGILALRLSNGEEITFGSLSTETATPLQHGIGSIAVGGNIGGNLIVGHGNVINMPAEKISLHSLYQLPPPPADFTGREVLITQLLNDFDSHKGATISGLTGMGGIGKTALGLVIANQLKDKYPDAQIFLDLKGTTMPLSARDILRHIILSFEPTADLRALDEANMSAVYQSVLHGKKVLLFLDNARSANQIAPLRPPETCAMLVTSRWIFTVPGLGSRRVDVMSANDAQKFLLELCPRIKDHAAELARACAYLPLALRIAGSFLQVNVNWKAEKYLEELKSAKGRFEIFAKSRAGAELTSEPDVLATLELSYNQLNDEEKRNWRALGVFPAAFDGASAAAVWGTEESDADDLLAVFMRYSLIDYNETAARYELHDLLAEYARSQMASGEEQEACIAHSVYYSNLLDNMSQLFLKGGANILNALKLYDSEWLHIEAGQRNSVVYLDADRKSAEACNRYAWQGHINELRLKPKDQVRWLESGLKASKVLGNKESEGAHLGNLGIAYAALGDVRKAIAFFEEDLIIGREIDDRRGEGNALGNLGSAYYSLGDVHKAIEFYEQRLVIAREIGDRHGEGAVLGNLGIAHKDLGDVRKAIELHEQALIVDRETGDRRGEGNALGNLGIAYAVLGDAHKAIQFYEQQLIIVREIGDGRGEGATLGNLGIAYAVLGDAHKAIQFYEQQLIIVREIGDRRGEGTALGNLGSAYYSLGNLHKAIESAEQALIIAREIGDRRKEGNWLGNLGIAYKTLGDAHKAIQFYEQQLIIVREIGDRRGEGTALFNMGVAFHGLDEKENAIDLVKQALKIYEAIESPYAERARNALKEWGMEE